MKNLKINFDEIQKAMEDVSRDVFDYYLDLETGDIISFSEEILGEVESKLYFTDSEEIGDNIEYMEFDEEPHIPVWMEDEVELILEILLDDDNRYVRIPERSPLAAFRSMESFIETVNNPTLRQELSDSLDGKGAFRRFKDVLLKYPKERKQWHGYNAKTTRGEILEWLNSIGVASVL
jgi:hypothetical protein